MLAVDYHCLLCRAVLELCVPLVSEGVVGTGCDALWGLIESSALNDKHCDDVPICRSRVLLKITAAFQITGKVRRAS